MTELRGIYTLWLREVKRYVRDRTRLISSFFQPIMWLVVFGAGIGSAFGDRFQIPGLTYQELIFPGIVGQTLLFTAMFMGVSVIWDKEFGFMKEILVAPISRFSIFLGKMLGDSTDALLQGIVVLFLGLALGFRINAVSFLLCLPIMLLITFGLVSIGLTIASFMYSLESYGAIYSFVNLPIFFLSGALYPVQYFPEWMQIASSLNPFTYGVDALRSVLLGSAWQTLQLNPLITNIAILGVFDIIMILIGTLSFSRVK